MPTAPPALRESTIASREHIPPGFWCVWIREPNIAQAARAAQYVAIDMPGPFALRLPLGIWTTRGDEFSVLFQEWGQRTTRLARLPLGTTISCIGPLGNEFGLPNPGQRATIIAGGLGVAPFWLLAKNLKAAGIDTTIVLGARRKELLVGASQLSAHSFPLEVCTDDGSAGFHGTVIERLASLPAADRLYGCGPAGMLRALCAYARERGIACQVSLEETFACSMGTCWGCVVPVRRGCPQGSGYPKAPGETRDYDFARVCADGTVFAAADLRWPA